MFANKTACLAKISGLMAVLLVIPVLKSLYTYLTNTLVSTAFVIQCMKNGMNWPNVR